jgi:DNA-directed RNA polymerase specialized sigma24 family protein
MDQDSLMREIASLRTYLTFVAGRFGGVRALQGRGLSDLVDSVLGDAFAKVRWGDGRFTFKSDKELRSWLVNRLHWTYLDALGRDQRLAEILRGLQPRHLPRTPGSEVAIGERARLLAEARAKLDPADNQLIQWREDDELTFEEIGRRRGYSASYARRAYLDAMQRLGSIYLGIGGDPPP